MPDTVVEMIAQRVVELLWPLLEQRQVRARLYSIKAASTYYGRSEASLRHLINADKLCAVRIDGRVMLDIRDLDSLIESSKTGG